MTSLLPYNMLNNRKLDILYQGESISCALCGWPLTWKSQGKNLFDENIREKSRKFMKNCQSQGKGKLFCKCLRKCRYHKFYFHILSKDKGYQCYFLLHHWQIWVRENILSYVKVRENENFKIMAALFMDALSESYKCHVWYQWSHNYLQLLYVCPDTVHAAQVSENSSCLFSVAHFTIVVEFLCVGLVPIVLVFLEEDDFVPVKSCECSRYITRNIRPNSRRAYFRPSRHHCARGGPWSYIVDAISLEEYFIPAVIPGCPGSIDASPRPPPGVPVAHVPDRLTQRRQPWGLILAVFVSEYFVSYWKWYKQELSTITKLIQYFELKMNQSDKVQQLQFAMDFNPANGEPAVPVHHRIVRRWSCGLLVTQHPLSLFLSMTSIVIVFDVTLLLSMTYQFQSCLGKKLTGSMGNKTNKPSIAI